MKVELFPFQKTALARLRQSVATALGNYRSTHTPQVVSYTAPTGAGKTIVMSALIEAIYYGDELYPDQNEAIIPYSILDSRVYEGEEHRRGRQYGLLDLDPAPHFDLVIIDEAHHIRNGSLDKDKAFAYKCVRFFCEHADNASKWIGFRSCCICFAVKYIKRRTTAPNGALSRLLLLYCCFFRCQEAFANYRFVICRLRQKHCVCSLKQWTSIKGEFPDF